jgi:mRNA-binding protein PUF3
MPSQQQYSNYFTGAYNAYLPHGIYPNLEPYIQGIPPTVIPAAPPYQGAGFGHVGVSAHQGHNQSRTVPSQWVADFSALVKVHEKKQHLTLGALSGHVVEASGDQEVSRFIQTKLSTAKSDEKEKLFNEIGPDMVPLMRDLFGNYVIQKLIEHGSQAQKARMVEAAKGHLVELSMNKYGCRVIQKLTDSCLVHQIAELLEEIQDIDVLKSLMQDEYANHVIQKFVQALPAPDFRFITVACQKNARELSTDQNSCRIVQRVLEYAHKDDVRTLLTELHLLMDRLITDSWGNYVAGHIIQNSPEDRESIFNVVMSRLLTLCQNKTASHVVEKCIKYGTPEQRTQIRERLSPINDADNTLYNTLRDQFGNYVVGEYFYF